MSKPPRPKVICIGFHKTGTTSLSIAMKMLGYPIAHGSEIFHEVSHENYNEQFMGHVEQKNPFREEILSALCDGINRTHGIQDSPSVFFYKDFVRLYPNAKFIFTTREETAWLDSLKAFVRDKSNPLRRYMYNVPKLSGNEHIFIDTYRQYTNEINSHFEGNPNFRAFDIGKGELDWENLLDFLGDDFYPDREHLGAIMQEFPRANVKR